MQVACFAYNGTQTGAQIQMHAPGPSTRASQGCRRGGQHRPAPPTHLRLRLAAVTQRLGGVGQLVAHSAVAGQVVPWAVGVGQKQWNQWKGWWSCTCMLLQLLQQGQALCKQVCWSHAPHGPRFMHSCQTSPVDGGGTGAGRARAALPSSSRGRVGGGQQRQRAEGALLRQHAAAAGHLVEPDLER